MGRLMSSWLFQSSKQPRNFTVLITLPAAACCAALLLGPQAGAQEAAPPGPQAAVQPPPEGPVVPASGSGTDDAWLQKAGSLYYSTAKSGMSGFDCAVHPDWRTLFASANAGSTVDANDARILLLDTVKINLHAHMQGGSTLEWTADASNGQPLDQDSSTLLKKMREVTEQTLEGFLQFWTPFVDGSVVPASAEGLTITHTGSVNTIHAQDSDTALTETFGNDMMLEHFDVDMNGISIKFQPAYKPTGQGWLVKSFQAHVQPAGVPPEQAQEMHVDIEYQTLGGIPIPSRLNMEMTNTGNFNFVLDGCTVSRLQKPEPANVVKPALQ
jgi:hypothetical protein